MSYHVPKLTDAHFLLLHYCYPMHWMSCCTVNRSKDAWMCIVCFYTDNSKSSDRCDICSAFNPGETPVCL
jgi:hypothetical protein